uniref:Glycoside hydrolase family 71 protein n=1 Tax=Panagrolaimus superbus TaxID=310955 RepID=A0A914Y579_9BILA
MGFSYPVDVNFFKQQMQKAKFAGIDGFALNVGIDDWQPDRVQKAVSAAEAIGFKIFISFDMTSLGFDASHLNRFTFAASSSAYERIGGRPLFSTFVGENNDGFWQSWKSSTGFNPYFCPCWPNYPTQNLLQNHPVADCIFTWQAWPPANSGPDSVININGDQQLLNSARATGKQYMAPISPWFYSHVWGNGWSKNWLYHSEMLLPTRWQQIISLNPDMVEIITWNDYSESHYICSIGADLPTGMQGINQQVNQPQRMVHDAWLELSKHYIQWYKNGQRPAVTQDQFYWWYRIHPKNNVNGDVPQYRNDANDCVTVHTIVKSVTPRGGKYKMIVDLNNNKHEYFITKLEQTECIPFPSNPGYVTLSMIGPDGKVWWADGKNAAQQSSGNNFNAFSNYYSFGSP